MSDLYLPRLRNWFLHSPPAEFVVSRLRNVLIGALSQGPIPRHVAFVMDGNRRYARNHKIETIEGHHLGFEALARVRSSMRNSAMRAAELTDQHRCSRFATNAASKS